MINVVNWNIGKHKEPWRELVRMVGDGGADMALVQEAGSPPGDVVDLVDYDDGVFWNRHVYDRWRASDDSCNNAFERRAGARRPRLPAQRPGFVQGIMAA